MDLKPGNLYIGNGRRLLIPQAEWQKSINDRGGGGDVSLIAILITCSHLPYMAQTCPNN